MKTIPGWCWRMLGPMAVLGLIMLSHSEAMRSFVAGQLGASKASLETDDRVLYLVRRDYLDGIGAGVALALSLVIAAISWKWSRREGVFFTWFSVLWLSPPIIKAAVIDSRCSDLMDAEHAKCGWATVEDYLYDRTENLAYWVTLAAIVVLIFILNRKFDSDVSKTANEAGADPA